MHYTFTSNHSSMPEQPDKMSLNDSDIEENLFLHSSRSKLCLKLTLNLFLKHLTLLRDVKNRRTNAIVHCATEAYFQLGGGRDLENVTFLEGPILKKDFTAKIAPQA